MATTLSTGFAPLFPNPPTLRRRPTTAALRFLSPKNPKSPGLGAGAGAHGERRESVIHEVVQEYELRRCVKKGNYLDSFELFWDLVGEGYTPDDEVTARLITGLSESRNLSKAVKVFEVLERDGNPGRRVYSALIRAYVRAKRTRNATSTLHRMVDRGILPGASDYNVVITELALKGEVGNAMALYKEMLRYGLEPVYLTYSHLVEAAVSQGVFDKVPKILGDMERRGMQPGGSIQYGIAKGLCKLKNPDPGLELFRMMEEDSDNQLKDTHYGAIIGALWNHGNQVRALQFTLEMLDKGTDPGHSTYRTLISCLCKDGLVDEAIGLLLDMDRTRFGPDYRSYRTAVAGLCINDRVCDAIDLLAAMVEKGCKPDQPTYAGLIQAVGRTGLTSEALQLASTLQSMKVLSQDSISHIRRYLFSMIGR